MVGERPEFSVVVPVYNSEASLSELHARLTKVFLSLDTVYELIFVDDGSEDESWEILLALHEEDKNTKILQMFNNVGQNLALLCGLQHAEGRYIITMDDDLQHPPEEIPKFIDAIKAEEGYFDVIIGVPIKKKHNVIRNAMSGCANLLISHFMKKPRNLKTGPFRIMKREVTEIVNDLAKPVFTLGATLFKVTKRIKNIEFVHHDRKYGKSGYSLKRITRLGKNHVFMNSKFPLSVLSSFGVVLSIFTLGYTIWHIISSLMNSTPISTSTVFLAGLLFVSGLLLLSQGLVGEYLLKIIESRKDRSLYYLREKKL